MEPAWVNWWSSDKNVLDNGWRSPDLDDHIVPRRDRPPVLLLCWIGTWAYVGLGALKQKEGRSPVAKIGQLFIRLGQMSCRISIRLADKTERQHIRHQSGCTRCDQSSKRVSADSAAEHVRTIFSKGRRAIHELHFSDWRTADLWPIPPEVSYALQHQLTASQ